MARKSKVVREKKLWAKPASEARQKLKLVFKDENSSAEDIFNAMISLQKRDLKECESRKRRRCGLCGRPRGVYRAFGLCRCCVRKYMNLGLIPGFVKSS